MRDAVVQRDAELEDERVKIVSEKLDLERRLDDAKRHAESEGGARARAVIERDELAR